MHPKQSEKVGIALQTIHLEPLNALRHKAENGTCGWYIWGGTELGEENNFFQPLHVSHLSSYVPEFLAYLDLPEGYRVLLAPNQKEIWFDKNLLKVNG